MQNETLSKKIFKSQVAYSQFWKPPKDSHSLVSIHGDY
jgi:hypothetical protein